MAAKASQPATKKGIAGLIVKKIRILMVSAPHKKPDWFKELFLQDSDKQYRDHEDFKRQWLGEWVPENHNKGELMKHLEILMKGGRVKRYHTESVIGHQNVAEHSWNMVLIIDRLWPDASKELIMAALYHDTAEVTLGDIPAPTKRVIAEDCGVVLDSLEAAFHSKTGTPNSNDLGATDKLRLKVADYLELVLFCKYQFKLGNEDLLSVEQKGRYYARKILEDNPKLGLTMSDRKRGWINGILA